MSGFLAASGEWIHSLLQSLGYWGVALVIFAQNIVSPLPSEFVLPLAGTLVDGGSVPLLILILAATAGSLIYSLALWTLGRMLGEKRVYRVVERYGRWLLLRTSDVQKAQRFFDRHGGKAVFLGRFLTGIRSVVPLPVGIAGMPVLPFSLYTVLGSGIVNAALISFGAVLRENWNEIVGYLETFGYVGYANLIAIILWFAIVRLRGRRAATGDSDEKP